MNTEPLKPTCYMSKEETAAKPRLEYTSVLSFVALGGFRSSAEHASDEASGITYASND